MSNPSSHDDDTVARATTVHARKGGNAGKWLAGGLIAVVLGGAGYMAWKNTAQNATETQTAANDPYAADSMHAGPLAPSSENSASPGASATAPAITQSAPALKPARPTTSAPVPQETIGVTPVSSSTQDFAASDESIVVNAPRHPVWSRMPSSRRLSALYPVVAQEQGREGEAQLHCTVLQTGALNCARISETRGFGNAALRVAGTLRHAPRFADGSDAVGEAVNLRVVFRLPPEERRG